MRLAFVFIVFCVFLLQIVAARRDDRPDIDEYRSRRDRDRSDYARSEVEDRIRSRRDDVHDMKKRRRSSSSHEERIKNDKEDNYKHREFLRKRKNDVVGRIQKAALFAPEEKETLSQKMEELHAHEMTLADSRLQIVLDFEGVRDMHDKEERRAYLDERRARREKQREKDNVTREKIKEIREHVDARLREAERVEL